MRALQGERVAVVADLRDPKQEAFAAALCAEDARVVRTRPGQDLAGFAIALAFDATVARGLTEFDGSIWFMVPRYECDERPGRIGGVEAYICATSLLENSLRQAHRDAMVFRTALPVHPAFRNAPDRATARQALGVPRAAITLFSWEECSALARALAPCESDPRFHVVTPEDLARHGGSAEEQGALALAACDLYVGVPTAHRLAQALTVGRPILALARPGDSASSNVLPFLPCGNILLAHHAEDLAFHLESFATDGARRSQLAQAARNKAKKIAGEPTFRDVLAEAFAGAAG